MADDKKILAFDILINGMSVEQAELAKLNLALGNLNKAKQELLKSYQAGKISEQQAIASLASLNKAIVENKDKTKELTKVVDTASDSLARKKALLIQLKQEYDSVSGVVREKMAPGINKLTSEISKAEQAIGTHTRGVGNYSGAIKGAIGQIFGIAAPAAAAAFALNGLKEAFAGTEAGANLLGRAKLQLTAFFDAIVEGKWKYALGNELPKDIKIIADLMNKIRIDERKEIVAISEKELDIKNLRLEAIKAGKDSVKQVELLTLAEKKQDELIQVKLNHKGEELHYVNLLLEKDKENTVYLNKQAQLQADINNILGERSLRIASKLEAAQEKKDLKEQTELIEAQTDAQRALVVAKQEAMHQDMQKRFADNPFVWKVSDQVAAVTYTNHVKDNIANIGNLIDKANARIEEEERKKANAIERIQTAHEQAKAKIMQGAANILGALAGKNKTLQKAALVADKAVAIAEIIIQTRKANALLTAWGAVAPPVTTILAFAARQANNIAAGVNIAAVVAATAAGLAGFNKGGKINRGIPFNTGTKDDTLIAVNKTETVLTQQHVQRLGGSGIMRQIGVPGYEMGGYLGSQSPEIPSSGYDFRSMVNAIKQMQIHFDVNKLNAANSELSMINQTNRI